MDDSTADCYSEGLSEARLGKFVKTLPSEVVIPDSKNPQQVANNCTASELPPLTPATHEVLSKFYSNEVAPHIRGKYLPRRSLRNRSIRPKLVCPGVNWQ